MTPFFMLRSNSFFEYKLDRNLNPSRVFNRLKGFQPLEGLIIKSAGYRIIPAPTTLFVPSSISIRLPVSRFFL